MDRTKKILISLLVLGALAAVGTGTYATFNATVANQGNTFQSGTILLSQTLNSGSACLSYGAGPTISAANSNNCGAVWNLGSSTNTTSDIPGTGGLILKNTGTIPATTLQLKSAAACTSTNAQAVYGSGNICSGLTVGVQEETAGPLFGAQITSGTAGVTGITLAANTDPAYPLGTMLMLVNAAGNTQVVTLAAATAANATSLTVDSFTANATYATTDHIYVPATGGCFVGYTESAPTGNANACVFDSTATTAAVAGGNLAAIDSGVTLTGGLGAGSSRYFAFGIALENSANNTLQGLCIGAAGVCGTYTMNWTIQ